MNDELIIRSEAERTAHRWGAFRDNHDGHSEFIIFVKEELQKFYTPTNKAVFLDEISQQIRAVLDKHIQQCANHQNGKPCPYEIKIAKVLFYLQQEVAALPAVIHPNQVTNNERSTVFVSYAHADKPTLDFISRHFRPLEKHIVFWDDSHIKLGQKWRTEIQAAMSRAKVALMLLSADFFGSKFVVEEELPKLLKAAEEDGAIILFLVVKPCMLDAYPQLTQYQGLNYQNNTFIQMTEGEKEALCVNLVTQIRDLLAPVSAAS